MREEASAELIARARHDRAAFAQVYRMYLNRIYSFFLAHTGQREQAEDLTSLTFERALRTIDRYEDRGKPLSRWLFRIAGNTLAERIRRDGHAILVNDAALRDEAETTPSPDQRVEHWERVIWLQTHIATLSVDQQMVLQLRFWDDLAIPDVAARMGRTEAATRRVLSRAVVALRMRLAEDDGDDDEPQQRPPRHAIGRSRPIGAARVDAAWPTRAT